jgi:TPR repeat protein
MFVKAANGGNGSALNNVALCYERGYGTDVDIEIAYDTYLKGAMMGSPQAMFSVGYLAIKRAMAATSSSELLRTIVSKSGIQKPNMEETLDSAKSTSEAISILRRIHTFRRVAPTKNIDFNSDREALLRNGIRWMRRASESSVGEAGYQLGLLYERVSFICL